MQQCDTLLDPREVLQNGTRLEVDERKKLNGERRCERDPPGLSLSLSFVLLDISGEAQKLYEQ